MESAAFSPDSERSMVEFMNEHYAHSNLMYAQVSIHGGISRPGLEHLASTDRGITMLRNMLRRGIRAIQNGADPQHMHGQVRQVITTYSQDRVIAGIPPALTPEEDRQLLRETGRKVVEDCQQLAQTV